MNKTIIININGIIFHIEEDAYEVLQKYMTEVKRHFGYSKDSQEIFSDIENRIGEMLQECLIRDKKQMLVVADVQEVTAQMGSVDDFEDSPAGASYAEADNDRKLFRDPDDKIIAGVCSGVGHYFNIESRWMRLILILLTLAGGAGPVIYIILWIILPVAHSRAEKMAMKGEPINLQNFKKNLDDELESLKENFSKMHREVRPGMEKAGNFISEIFESILNLLGKIIKVLVKVAGILIIFFAAAGLVVLLVGFFALLGFGDAARPHYFPFNVINPEYRDTLYLSAFVLLGIPLSALLFFAIAVTFNVKIITKTAAFIMLMAWLVALFTGIYNGTRVGAEFSDEAAFSENTTLKASPVYYLKLDDSRLLSRTDSDALNLDQEDFKKRIIIDEDYQREPRAVWLNIEKSDSGQPVLTKTFSSRGPDFAGALEIAKNISYRYSQADSILLFNENISIPHHALWRDQEVKLKLQIPVNSRVIIDSRLNNMLYGYNLWDCKPHEDKYPFNSEWVMTSDGLKCASDSTLVNN